MLSNGYPDQPAKVGLPITDLIAGSNAITGIMMALYQRQITGEGAYIDISMFDAALNWLGYFPHHAWHSQAEPPMSGMRHQYIVPYGPFLASDGRYVSLVVAHEKNWKRLCEDVIDKPEWVTDPKMMSIAARLENRVEAEAAFEKVIATQPSDYWKIKLDKVGIPYGDVNTMADVIKHPQALARNMFVETESEHGNLPLVRFPLAPVDKKRRLPKLGEHTASVLKSITPNGRTKNEN